MADNEKIIEVAFKANPGNAPQQAEAAGKQTGDAFTRAAEEAIKKLNVSGALEAKLGRGGTDKSFLNNISDNISKAVNEGIVGGVTNLPAIMPKVQLPAPSVPKEVLGDVERATLGINTFLSGMKAFTTFFEPGASMLTVAQLGGQAFDFGQRYQRAQAEATAAASVARAEAAAARASSADIVAEMSGAGGFRAAASVGGGAAETAALGGGAAALAGGGGPPGGLKNLIKIGGEAVAVVGVGAAVIEEAVKSRDQMIELAEQGAEKYKHGKFIRQIMGATPEEMDKLKFSFQQVGVPISELEDTFVRLAVRARRAMPEIAREVEDSADRQTEANIKVEESGRALAKAHDNIALSVDRAKKAQGELIKVQQTEQEAMTQQRRAADLAVSGAQLGERGAQMRATQAAINLMAAPEQARIADIQGPTTVRGAELGAQGARIALAEARARYYGQEPDEDLQERKRQHALQVAINNAEQAEVQERQARLNERKRLAEKALGVGPEAQAQLQADQAGQAKEMAELHTQQAELARKRLVIEQDNHDYAAKEREARAASDEAIRGVPKAVNDEVLARIANTDAIKAENRGRFKQIPVLQAAIRGEVEPGFPVSQIDQEQLRKAIIEEGGGNVKGIIEALRKYRESPLITRLPEDQQVQQMATIAQQLSGRGLGGSAEKFADLVMERREIPPDMLKLFADRQKARDEAGNKRGEQANAVLEEQAKQQTLINAERDKRLMESMVFAPGMISQQTADKMLEERFKTGAVTTYNLAEGGLRTADKVLTEGLTSLGTVAKDGATAVGEFVGALRNAIGQIGSAKPAGKTEPTRDMLTGAELTGPGEAEGGLLHGLGSGTSDQIPIMASPGEFVVNAESVSKPGVLGLLHRINNGFAGGGEVIERRLDNIGKLWTQGDLDRLNQDQLHLALYRAGVPYNFLTRDIDNLEMSLAKIFSKGTDLASSESTQGYAFGGGIRERRGEPSGFDIERSRERRGEPSGFDIERSRERSGEPSGFSLEASRERSGEPSGLSVERSSEMQSFAGGGTVATGAAPDATILRNPFVSSADVSYQERALMEHDGFDPDNPNDVKLWRERVGSKLPRNMGMPGGPTGAGVIARGQVARGPAPPILMVKPGVGTDYTIPTPGGGAYVKYNPLAGRYWPEGSGKPYDANDQTTFGKPGVKFDPMNSSTWSPGYMNDFYTAPGYTDIKTSDKDLATPISFGRHKRDEPVIERSQEAQDKFPEGSYYKFKEGWFRQGRGDFVDPQLSPPPADTSNKVFDFTGSNRPEDEPAKIQQMIDTSREEERKRIEEEQNRYQEATGGLIRRYFRSGGRVGMQAGGFPPAPDMGGWITKAALSDLSERLGNIPSSGRALTPSASALAGLNTLGVHQLDLRTNAGNFPAAVSEETWAAIQRTSLMNQVSSAGSRPSWYS